LALVLICDGEAHALISYSKCRVADLARRIGVLADWLMLMAASV
jgi:hypothetical protein